MRNQTAQIDNYALLYDSRVLRTKPQDRQARLRCSSTQNDRVVRHFYTFCTVYPKRGNYGKRKKKNGRTRVTVCVKLSQRSTKETTQR